MLRRLRLDALRAELSGVLSQVEISDEYGDIVGSGQFRRRLEQIKKEISSLELQDPKRASVALYFSGRPVLGTRGIAADFAGRCLENYQDLVSKTFARRELGSLGDRGPIPLRQNTEMMVTGVTHGSFGFILDEMSDQTSILDTQLKEVVKEVSLTLEKFSGDSESEFLEFASEIDQRTVISLRKFFQEMDNSLATVRIVEDIHELNLDSPAVLRARKRAESSTIEDETADVPGTSIHVLPEHRTFEFRTLTGDVLFGKAHADAVESYLSAIAMQVNVANSRMTAHMQVRTVHAFNREPRSTYRLRNLSIEGGLAT
ncbi:hypothetical protein [Xanthomonas arboricola]|uniref:hypothetical protein n=1 Tax=Xanthomonas arboricola TaxID=56448 RepID=UPI0011B0CEC7|nr:hypothetical protein [Xanthomonas arboricola]